MENKTRKDVETKKKLRKTIAVVLLLASLIIVGGAAPAMATRHSFSDVGDGLGFTSLQI